MSSILDQSFLKFLEIEDIVGKQPGKSTDKIDPFDYIEAKGWFQVWYNQVDDVGFAAAHAFSRQARRIAQLVNHAQIFS